MYHGSEKGVFDMQLTFTNAAQKRLSKYLSDNKQMLLDYDDGVGPFSATGSCSMDNNFKLIFVDKDKQYKDFDASLNSNLGTIFYKGYTRPQLEDQMTVRFNPHTFTMPLSTPHGLLTEDLEILDFSGQKAPVLEVGPAHDC